MIKQTPSTTRVSVKAGNTTRSISLIYFNVVLQDMNECMALISFFRVRKTYTTLLSPRGVKVGFKVERVLMTDGFDEH